MSHLQIIGLNRQFHCGRESVFEVHEIFSGNSCIQVMRFVRRLDLHVMDALSFSQKPKYGGTLSTLLLTKDERVCVCLYFALQATIDRVFNWMKAAKICSSARQTDLVNTLTRDTHVSGIFIINFFCFTDFKRYLQCNWF